MARLTEKDSIDNKRYMLNSEENIVCVTNARLTNCATIAYCWGKPIDKLAQLEDIMEKYGIESVEELDKLIGGMQSTINVLLQRNKNIKTDRDTWKKACELACKWFKQTGFIGDQTEVDYYYQQAKQVIGK